ncbi:hypothetical protein D3C84_698480 [compost metagenome]
MVHMGRIAAYGMDLCPDVIALLVQLHVTTALAVGLNGLTQCALGSVTDEENIVSQVVQHDYQIIDDSTAAAHSVPCDDDGRTSGFRQMANPLQMCFLMAIDAGSAFSRGFHAQERP